MSNYFFLHSFINGTKAKIATKVIDIVPNIVNAISAIIQSLNKQTTAKIVIPTITILAIAKPISNINIIQNSYIFLIVNLTTFFLLNQLHNSKIRVPYQC